MKDDTGRDLAIFTEALRLPVEKRGAYLDRECTGDVERRRRVEALLSAHDRVGDFLEGPLEIEPEPGNERESGDAK